MRYVAFVHDDDEPGFGASFPDFPGCVSDGDTVDDALRRGAEALSFHVEGMLADGEPIPSPRSLHDIRADESLAGWRNGATIAFVPLILDKGSPRRINVSLDTSVPSRKCASQCAPPCRGSTARWRPRRTAWQSHCNRR